MTKYEITFFFVDDTQRTHIKELEDPGVFLEQINFSEACTFKDEHGDYRKINLSNVKYIGVRKYTDPAVGYQRIRY